MTLLHVLNTAIESFSPFVSRAALTLVSLWKKMLLRRQTQLTILPNYSNALR